jgi:glycosyltransferase involved in cell wall biosynthesis
VLARIRSALGLNLLPRIAPDRRRNRLVSLIRELKPDIVHSIEMQAAGYLCQEAKAVLGEQFPPWIVTIWGSDIYHFRRFEEHEEKIRAVLAQCDYFTCECMRDVKLAEAYGTKAHIFPPFPVVGGFDIRQVDRLRCQGKTSARRKIVLKGYQGWAGRALCGLKALELCADVLNGYEVCIYSASGQVKGEAAEFSARTGVPAHALPRMDHDDMLRMHGSARISIGLSISDGISVSFLEAIVMGSFPVQSRTACADEWVTDGETGLLVAPEDPEEVARAIRKALMDDALVDNAADRNSALLQSRLDSSWVQELTLDVYRTVMKDHGIP